MKLLTIAAVAGVMLLAPQIVLAQTLFFKGSNTRFSAGPSQNWARDVGFHQY
jgi:uncharacterized protein YraI